MFEPCDICGVTGMRRFLEVSLVGMKPACVHRCPTCGFRQIRPRLTAAEIKALYPSDYFDSVSPVGYADYAREFQRRQREAYFLAQWLGRLGPRGRLLEVGCALGFLLAGLNRSGWRVEGVDASPFAAYYARTRYGIDVVCATLEGRRYRTRRSTSSSRRTCSSTWPTRAGISRRRTGCCGPVGGSAW